LLRPGTWVVVSVNTKKSSALAEGGGASPVQSAATR
jgi:hypothetical protein